MSTLFPKRVKDLPPLEPDSEDDRTPAKIDRGTEKRLAQDYSRELFSAMRVPRRVSELPPLESDSEDEDNRLNCGILNESFILSPSDNEHLTLVAGDSFKENDRNKLNQDQIRQKSDNLFLEMKKLLITDEQQTDISSRKKNMKSRQTLLPLLEAMDSMPQKHCMPSLPSFNNCNANMKTTGMVDVVKMDQSTLNHIKDTPKMSLSPKSNISVSGSETKENDKRSPKSEIPSVCNEENLETLETPCKDYEQNFVTPQVKSFQMPVSRIAKLPNSGTFQKCRSVLENEFLSEKVLFRTPIALSRPMPSLQNNSITLSLDETLHKGNTQKEEKKTCNRQVNCESKIIRNIEKQKDSKVERIILINGKEYIIQKKLGSGGSSSVFLALRKNNETECALKIVDLKGDPAVVEGYLNETRLLAQLQGNDNVVALYEYEHLVQESKLFMVMEKGDSDLHKILQSYKTDLPLYILMTFWHQILDSVNYIHQNGVIHSDLKPANFLMVNGRLKLIDFGIASNISIDSTSIIKFSQAGTFNYISPEALIDTSSGNSPTGKSLPKIKISTKSDVWSLGCILYLLVYKKTPFGHIKNVYAKVNAISNPKTEIEYPELACYYPSMLIDMAKRCLQHNPKKRISVAELLKYPFEMVVLLKRSQQERNGDLCQNN